MTEHDRHPETGRCLTARYIRAGWPWAAVLLLMLISASVGGIAGFTLRRAAVRTAKKDAASARAEALVSEQRAAKASAEAEGATRTASENADELARLRSECDAAEQDAAALREELKAIQAIVEASRKAQGAEHPPEPEDRAVPMASLARGMTPADAEGVMGKPAKKGGIGAGDKLVEIWQYPDGAELRFVDGVLSAWQAGKADADMWEDVEQGIRELRSPSSSEIEATLERHLSVLRASPDRFAMRASASALGSMGAEALPALPDMMAIYLSMLRGCLRSPDHMGGGDRYARARLVESLGRIAVDGATPRQARTRIVRLLVLARTRDPLRESQQNAVRWLEKLVPGVKWQ